MEEVKRRVAVVDSNIEQMVKMSILHVIQLGTKHGVFKVLSRGPTQREVLDSVDLPNRKLLMEFLDTLRAIGIVEEQGNQLKLNGFSYLLKVPQEHYDSLLPGWVSILEEIYRMVDYAFITPTHPHVLMDFDKDADFWDIRMNTDFATLYRDAIAAAGEISSGASVLDLGCGSVAPYDFGKRIGYTGFYTGVDYSSAILEIARMRAEENSLPVELKELDVRLIRPVNEYDTAVISFLLEYLKPEDYGRVLRRTLEALKPGGKLVIVEPFRDRFKHIEALEFFEKLNKDFKRFPEAKEVIGAVEKEGFDVAIKEYGRSMIVVSLMP
ncbi:methyltransferase [Thermococcus profundus]|uniref:Methyltransferase n=1 Tax=Thermococcus profundus TaxID=49899 RepID=A0A2Z2M7Z7_THEPR|nr:class I SAM-dependent methyltransferase [Thermococcus profundus]ASJ02570.1 methyltransferase [Thermococcus profundus]